MMRNSTVTAARSVRARCTPATILGTTRVRTLTSSGSRRSANVVASSTSEQEQITAGEQKIRELLTTKFQPSMLKVQDVSGECRLRCGSRIGKQATDSGPTRNAQVDAEASTPSS